MSDSQSLARIERRQVEANQILTSVLGVMEVLQEIQAEMVKRIIGLEEWLQEPPKSDFVDLLKRLVVLVEELPAEIVRAVNGSEMSGRG